MKLRDVARILENLAPLSLQETYDNVGLITGTKDQELTGIMICLDISIPVIREAIGKGCNMIISHHPALFKPIKRLTGNTLSEQILIELIRNNIAAYAVHTNLDNVANGVNSGLAQKLGLQNTRFLDQHSGLLRKLVTFCPVNAADKVREAICRAGAGSIGNYDYCTFNAEGFGTFRGNEKSNPYVGLKNEIHREKEVRIETVFPEYLQQSVISGLLEAHPYEEVAYDIFPLENDLPFAGSGMIGELAKSLPVKEFLELISEKLNPGAIKYSKGKQLRIKKIAICGGAGSFLIPAAIAAGADAFVTSDLKYHDFQSFEGSLFLVDAGHYETEIHVKDLIRIALSEKFPNFAIFTSKKEKNPVNYL